MDAVRHLDLGADRVLVRLAYADQDGDAVVGESHVLNPEASQFGATGHQHEAEDEQGTVTFPGERLGIGGLDHRSERLERHWGRLALASGGPVSAVHLEDSEGGIGLRLSAVTGDAVCGADRRYSTNLQVVIDANSRLVVAIGLPLPGSRNDCRAVTESGVDRACRGAPTIADGGYQGTGLLIPHRKRRGQVHLSPQQEAENAVHRRARARVEHALSRLKNWKILRDCRLKGHGVHQAMLGIARLHNLALTG